MDNTNVRVDSSKIRMPDVTGTVSRPRLLKRLEKNRNKNLIFLNGQAAQGKSTIAASYLQESVSPCAWINISADESNPVNLFYTLIFSLENAVQGIDLSPLRDYPALSAGPRDEAGLYRDWLNALFSQLPFPLHIVFDGLDRLDPDAPSNLFLKVCSEVVPPATQLWFLSRTGEPFNLKELKMNPKGFVMENSELSFTKNEIKKYFRKYNHIKLDKDHLTRVHRITEGWIGGLILLSEVLDRIPEEKQVNNLLSEVSSEFQMQAFQYFGEIIWESLPRRTQSFLIVSSIFETIEPELMADFYEGGDCKEILLNLVQRNLFVHSIYDEKEGWLFRCHQLFRDYLASRFNSDLEEDDRLAILHQAGSLCESRGRMEHAAHFYIRCGSYENAANVIQTIGMELLKMGRTTDLGNLIKALPKHYVLNNPWLLLYLSATRRFTGVEENVFSLQTALALFKQKAEVRGQILTLAFLMEASSFRGRDIIPLGILVEEAEDLLHLIPFEKYPWESATLWLHLGFGVSLRGGDLRKGYEAIQNAYLLSRSIGNSPLQIAALVNSLIDLSLLGEFELSEKMSQKALLILEKEPYPELRALYLLHYSMACTTQGKLSLANDCVNEAKELLQEHGLLYLYPLALLSELMLMPQMGDFIKGEETGRQLLEFSKGFGLKLMKALAFMCLGTCYYLKQDYKAAGEYFKASCRIVFDDDSYSENHIMYNKIFMGIVYIHQKKLERAEILLKEALDHSIEISSHLITICSNWALAFVNHTLNCRNKTINHLKAGIKVAQDHDIYYLMWMNEEDILRVGQLCIEYNLKETESYIAHLFALRPAGSTVDILRRYINQTPKKTKRMALNILGYVHRFHLPRILVVTINNFSVYRNDHRTKDEEWGGNLPQSLLKAIITHGGRQVPKERIMEDLWPDAPQSASETNFKVNLHRLRKLLEPSMLKELGSSYIRLKGNLVSLDEELFEIDIDNFTELIRKAKKAKSEGDSKYAIRYLNDAINLYQSDFLEEDLYNEAISHKREKLRQQYAEAMFQLAALYETKGALKKAEDLYKKIIASDPFSESAHQKLMINYANRGKTSEAIQTYLKYENALRTELDTDPDDVTRSVYERLRDIN
jgi:ATP/maltotriose-dependent transcriptional regulator MalT/DNA-binding SARP family transcriptional activator